MIEKIRKIIDNVYQNFNLSAGLIIFATTVVYISLVNNLNVWSDEIYSVLMAKDSFSDMWQLLITEDSKPPLYYLYLKFILFLFPHNYEIWAAHFGSFLLLIIAQIFTAIVIKKDFGKTVALWLILLIALLPHSLWLAFEVRTYLFSALLILIVAVYGLRLIEHSQTANFVKFGIFSLLALYSHYYCAIWLFFFYSGILFYLLKNKSYLQLQKFLITALSVAILFAPWLYIPLLTGKEISQVWYVNWDFVTLSWQFFVNPLSPEIFQSTFFIATTFATSTFSFLLLLGIFSAPKRDTYYPFILVFGSFIVCYIFLFALSYFVRPMVTSRYLKIFSLLLYFAAAFALKYNNSIKKVCLLVFMIGFVFTYIDIRAIAFDLGYSEAVKNIRKFVPQDFTILTIDNSNLFCEYYLPEYNCVHIITDGGEVLRRPTVAKQLQKFSQSDQPVFFVLSLFTSQKNQTCIVYDSDYRTGQKVTLCRYTPEEAEQLIEYSKQQLHNPLKELDS